MKRICLLLGGAAALALAAGAVTAQAQDPQTHEITVQLPGGGVEHITYSGNPNLHVSFERAPEWNDPFAAAFAPSFWSSFDALNQISAQMDRQMNAMLARAEAMQAQARSGELNAAFGNAPPGTFSYEQVTTWTGNGICTHTVRMTAPANGGRPQYVSNTSGDCGGKAVQPSSSNAIQAKTQAAPHVAPGTRI